MLKYLQGYPESIQVQAQDLIDNNKLGLYLERKYPEHHQVQSDKALYQLARELKEQYMRNAPPLASARFDAKLSPVKHTLGLHTYQAQVQGSKLKTRNSLTIAALFREGPPQFLSMILAHELAHFQEKDHNKRFYQLCCHIEPAYHQLELDTRLWLTWRDSQK
ncbi:MAG: YgjP-like metallopeptidase domain-containing protein [Pseudomonadota bacterium]|uniref:YgjP-like metallopeptidase domain-containing protein n=1 Tax=Gallaecimonas pentaromativorans TaxID=584787 RepID=UPI00067F2C8A|nr:YgjP-like metallopeptidase domain-containing protein [Gallaecimonas pentaromativorans]MED5523460.1 YgjP-like metallopeptidase domain-containing protein [Pseudomonadota bacterium]